MVTRYDSYASRLIDFLPSNQEVNEFVKRESTRSLLESFRRMRIWFFHLQELRSDEEPSVLLASAHSKVIETAVLVPLGLLHSSYMALRTVVDICTSYTFYCSHPIEWRAVCENKGPWEGRANIIDWHIHYTPTFREINKACGLADALNQDYQILSSYIHGVPIAGLPTLKGIERLQVDDADLDAYNELAERVDKNLNLLFLSIFHPETDSLSARDFKAITRNIDRRMLRNSGIILPRV